MDPPPRGDPTFETLVARCLSALERDGSRALDAFCREYPEHAWMLRSAVARLRDSGTLDRDEPGPDDSDRTAHAAAARPHDGSVAERLARIEALTSRPDRYADPEPIDEGGMGIVECVRDLQLGRHVARKSILPRFAARHGDVAVRRFLDEAGVLARLAHQGVIPIHDIGVDSTGPYLIMRWVRGQTLENLLFLRDEQWTEGRLIEVLIKVCDTITHAHAQGVLHRDLKPSNVMVGRFGEVYVIDWGLAKFDRSEQAPESPEPDSTIDDEIPSTGCSASRRSAWGRPRCRRASGRPCPRQCGGSSPAR